MSRRSISLFSEGLNPNFFSLSGLERLRAKIDSHDVTIFISANIVESIQNHTEYGEYPNLSFSQVLRAKGIIANQAKLHILETPNILEIIPEDSAYFHSKYYP